MVYKIQSVTFPETLGQDLKLLCKSFNVIVTNNIVFAAKKKFDCNCNLFNILKPKKNYFITEVTNNSLVSEPQEIRDWCVRYFTILEKQKYEAENQDRLQIAKLQLDAFENELKSALRQQEGGIDVE